MNFVVWDFETESACDLKKSGAWVYAEHPTTAIICLGFSIDGGETEVWEPGVYKHDTYWNHEAIMLRKAILDPNVIFVAHNCQFEKAIYRRIMVEQLGWPDLPNDRHHDTMAVCAMKGLPLALERASSALRLSRQKDTEGTKATLAYGRPNKRGMIEHKPEVRNRIFAYNRNDVEEQLELHRRVRGLGDAERKVWLLDQTINERGVRLDMPFVRASQEIVDQASKPLLKEFIGITGIEKLASPKFKGWLSSNGVEIANLQKETIAKLLGEDDDEEEESLAGDYDDSDEEIGQLRLPPACRRALQIRSVLGSASIKKLRAMQACVGSDGRARGLLQYHGASPGRWAGRLLQPQNFPRPSLKIQVGWEADGTEKFAGHDPQQLVNAIMTKDAEYVRMMFGEPVEAVANGLRHSIIAAEGCELEVGDFTQVEARIVLALAGQYDKCDMLAAGASPYIPMAESIFKRKIDKHVDIKEYTIGKNTILGCGFQMGAKKFRARYCPLETIEFAQAAIDTYRKVFAPEVPKLWYALQDASTAAVWNKNPYEAYGIRYQLEDGWLTCRLPSGRKLWYYDPKPVRKAMPWNPDDIRQAWEYSAFKKGQFIRVAAYGGLLTENVVQATARDLLVAALFKCEEANHPVILTVHDEAINEVSGGRADPKWLNDVMCDIPAWARERKIPMGADCWVGSCYRK